MTDEWFEEVCGCCGEVKQVHNDGMTPYDNPGFICAMCEQERNEILSEMEV